MAKHLIYKQKVTLHLSKKDEAYALQDRVSKMIQNGLMDGMEAILDKAFPPDKVVRIDKLQLDLGTIGLHNFESEFIAQFISTLTKSLSAKQESLVGSKGGEAVFSKAQATENALIFFLENGYLPWYSQADKKSGWEKEILENLSAAEYLHFFNWLKENYQERPVIIERLVLQFSDKFMADLLTAVEPVFDESWELVFADYLLILTKSKSTRSNEQGSAFEKTPETEMHNSAFEKLSEDEMYSSAIGKLAARDKIWQYVMRVLLADVKEDPALQILKLLVGYAGINWKNLEELQAKSIEASFKTKTVKRAFSKLAKQLKLEKEMLKHDEESNKGKGASPQNASGENSATFKNLPDNETIETPGVSKAPVKGVSVTKKTGPNEGDVIYVNNCGIVMLHPFLKPFFEGLSLAAAGKFLSEEARGRAVLLLHYIATGETEIAEFDLTLQKILCGYPLGSTLPSEIILTDNERAETDNLLKAVLSHWEPLKNTSIEGFRGTFLQRPGSLELKDSGWLLTVEQKTIDILLGKLPWGFSTIRMPWMSGMISIDWY